MTIRQEFQPILDEIQTIQSQIRLKLPASPHSISRQVDCIRVAEEHLATLKHTTHSHPVHPIVIQVIDRLNQTAQTLKLLAEEFLIDPEGSISCLESVKEHDADISAAIHYLRSRLLKSNNFHYAREQH
jgi:translation elongation factor EF-Ts